MTMPTLFLGHGSPLNAIRENTWTRTWARLGRALPRPRAILAVSAHWYIPGCAVTAMSAPRTIHDFGGFPEELYKVQYPARGDPALACRVQQRAANRQSRGAMPCGIENNDPAMAGWAKSSN